MSLALRSLAAEVSDVGWRDLTCWEDDPDWQAVVYDLCPWDEHALDVVRQVNHLTPAAPILLYVPHVPGVGPLLEACARDPRVLVKLQFNDGEEVERLHGELERVRLQIPCEQLAILLRAALPDVHPRVWTYVRRSLEALAQPRVVKHATARSISTAMGVSVRTVERALSGSGLPQPKELLNWITLLYILLTAERMGHSPAATARALHWRPNDLYRLRHRLLHRVSGAPSPNFSEIPSSEFDLAFLAFVKRCGVAEAQARGLLKRAG